MVSPDGNTKAILSISESGQLSYHINQDGAPVVESAPLGITFAKSDFSSVDGISASKVKYNNGRAQYVYSLSSGNSSLKLAFKLSDQGVAFSFFDTEPLNRTVMSEQSSWTLPANSNLWFFERLNDWKLKSYAGYWRTDKIENMLTTSKTGPVQGNPIISVNADKSRYTVLTESALINYSGMRLEAKEGRQFEINFTEGDAGFNVPGTFQTPWRTTLIARSLDDLVNNTLISDLSPEPDANIYENTDWIRPGLSAWRWWCCRLGSPEQEKQIIENASKLGFAHSLIDDGWKDWENPWENIKALTDFGKSLNVDVWLWKHSNEIIDPTNNWAQMTSFLDKVSLAGASGIKVDFMNAEDKHTIEFMTTLLTECAKRELMVNFHGSNASHGEAKTFPNEMTREGVRGLELNWIKEGPITAHHNAALPFTRYVVGHADYTPLGFTNPAETSWAHQLATLVSLTSPIQVIAEDTEFLLNEPRMQPILPILRTMPTQWSETRILDGSDIGELSLMARKANVEGKQNWYVAAMNGGDAKTVSVDLSFLGNGAFTLTKVIDDIEGGEISIMSSDPRKVGKKEISVLPFQVSSKTVTSNTSLSMKMAKNGGGVFVFTPQD